MVNGQALDYEGIILLTIQNLGKKGNGLSGKPPKTPKPDPVRSQGLVEVFSWFGAGLVKGGTSKRPPHFQTTDWPA